MIRKRKIAIVVAGALLLAGVAFGVSANNRDGLKSSIVEGRRGGFVCTAQAVAPGSRETKQYTANLAELQRLQARRAVLQSNTNVVENTCKNLKGKARTQCQKDVVELRTIEKQLDQLNKEIAQYEACKANDITFSAQKTQLSFSPFKNSGNKTLVAGDNILGEWSVSAKKGTATLNKLNFQAVIITGATDDVYGYEECNVFTSYELQDANGNVLSVGTISDPESSILVRRFVFSSPLVINAKAQKIRLVGKGFSGTDVVPATCQFEMNLSDNARSHVEREGDNSGFGPYGYVYEVQKVSAITMLTPMKGDIYRSGDIMRIKWMVKGLTNKNPDVRINIVDNRIPIGTSKAYQSDLRPILSYGDMIASNGDEATYEYVTYISPFISDTYEKKGTYGGENYNVIIDIRDNGNVMTNQSPIFSIINPPLVSSVYSSSLDAARVVQPGISEQYYRLEDGVVRQDYFGQILLTMGLIPNASVNEYSCKNHFSDTQALWVCRLAEIALQNNLIDSSVSSFNGGSIISMRDALSLGEKAYCMSPVNGDIVSLANKMGLGNADKVNLSASITRSDFYLIWATFWNFFETNRKTNASLFDSAIPGCADRIQAPEFDICQVMPDHYSCSKS